jgi:hypothetical protein
MKKGIVYNVTGESARGEVQQYHYKPEPLFLNKKAGVVDVASLKKRQQQDVLIFNAEGIESKFTIGFEVEKTSLSRGAVREYELFCGFERDGSCGYEAVTHILPLLPASTWRTKVYDMMHKAERIIDDRYSPSDARCGGHITIGVEGFSGDGIRDHIRKFSGLMYAMFRHRLKNGYCNHNMRMLEHDPYNMHRKYQVALVKGYTLEFRLPSRIESVKQMMRRYEFMYATLDVAINKPSTSFKKYVTDMKPLLMAMYDGDETKVDKVSALAVHFQQYINTGERHESILEFTNR